MTIILSWNINSIRIRVDLLVKLINQVNPDIILLQEIKCSNEDFPDFYSDMGYKAIINGQKGKYGVAIILKKKFNFEEIELKSEIFKKESRTNFVYIKEIDLKILNVYTPNGNPIENKEKFSFKMSWLEEVNKLVSKIINDKENLIVAGDFNVLENERDVKKFQDWEQDALGHINTRKKFREIIASGMTNIVRLYYQPGEIFSFWDYQRACWERNDGLLIDHFLISPTYLNIVRGINFEINYRGMDKPSDHIPLWIDLDI